MRERLHIWTLYWVIPALCLVLGAGMTGLATVAARHGSGWAWYCAFMAIVLIATGAYLSWTTIGIQRAVRRQGAAEVLRQYHEKRREAAESR